MTEHDESYCDALTLMEDALAQVLLAISEGRAEDPQLRMMLSYKRDWAREKLQQHNVRNASRWTGTTGDLSTKCCHCWE